MVTKCLCSGVAGLCPRCKEMRRRKEVRRLERICLGADAVISQGKRSALAKCVHDMRDGIVKLLVEAREQGRNTDNLQWMADDASYVWRELCNLAQ